MEISWKRISLADDSFCKVELIKFNVMMYKQILLFAFAKAETEIPAKTKTQRAEHLADTLWEEYGHQVSRRTLLNYYNNYKSGPIESSLSPKAMTIEALCKYLKYPSYAAFIVHHSSLDEKISYNSQTATYIVEGDNHRDVVTILIKRELTGKIREEPLKIA